MHKGTGARQMLKEWQRRIKRTEGETLAGRMSLSISRGRVGVSRSQRVICFGNPYSSEVAEMSFKDLSRRIRHEEIGAVDI